MRLMIIILILSSGILSGASEPSVVLITVDTLRPDALGWVAGKNKTPNLDKIAREGVAFDSAVAPAPVTLPSHTSIMTGLVPRRHGVRNNGEVLGSGPITLAARLKQMGYATAAFVSGYPLEASFGLDRGFDHYDDVEATAPGSGLERGARATTEAALAWLSTVKGPYFLWVHYYDPHDPYEPPTQYRRDGEHGAYYGEVALVDAAVAELRAAIKGEVLTVFAADHGESLGEHGEHTHGFFVYQSTMAVPLVFHYPGKLEPRQTNAPARLVDIMPTVLGLLRQKPPAELDGVDLGPLLRGEEQTLPAAVMESRRPWRSYGWAPLRAVRDGDWKLIMAPKPELYQLKNDPEEANNLVDSQRREARRLQALLREADARAVYEAGAKDDPETLSRLRSLGYTGGGGSGQAPPPGLPDPKDRLELWNLMGRAEGLMSSKAWQDALTVYDQVLAQDPENRFALSRSGTALTYLGQKGEALKRLARAVELDPQHAEIRTAYAQALALLGSPDQAAEQWMELLRRQPRFTHGWVQLANNLGRAGRPQQAVEALSEAIRHQPEDPELHVRRGFAAFAAKDVPGAIGYLKQAVALTGEASFPYPSALGLLLLQARRIDEALPWLQRGRPTEAEYGPAQLQLALLLLRMGKQDEAAGILHKAIEQLPGLADQARAHPDLAGLL